MDQEKPLDWNAKMVKFFYDRSRLVWLLIVGLLIGGAVSLMSLRSEGFPNVTPKIVFIQTIYPGAPSTEVESSVTKQIEAAIKDTKDLKEFSSTSQNSFSNVVVTLNESADLDKAVSDIQNKVQSARADLPKDAEQPKVGTFSTGGPAFYFGVTDGADVKSVNDETKKLATELGTVSGVKSAKLLDEQTYRVAVNYKPDELSKSGVALSNLSQVLQAANVTLPVGTLNIDNKTQSIISRGSFNSLDDIKNTVVGANPVTKKPVILSDVANVSEIKSDGQNINRFGYIKDGKLISVEGSYLTVTLTNDADILEVRDRVFDRINKIKDDGIISKSLEVVPLYDQGQFTEDQVREIVKGAIGSKDNLWLLGGLQLLFIAMLLLVNYRSALIATLAIPFSLAFTFISLKLTGTQLNTLVLFSLILVLGLVVDPAIVMIEAIQRYRDLKYKPREAVIESGRRYGASLFMAVLTSMLVFVPFGVVSGFFGEIIRYIPLTVLPALFASYFVPIALLPYLSRRLIKSSAKDADSVPFGEEEGLSRPAKFVMRVNSWILGRTWRKITILVVSLVLVVLSGMLVATGAVQIVQFAKPDDNQTIMITGSYNRGLTVEQKDLAHKAVEAAVTSKTAVKDFLYIDQNANNFTMYIDLKVAKERTASQDKSKELVKRISAEVREVKAFSDIVVDEVAVGPPSGSYQIQTQLADNDLSKLKSGALDVGAFLKGLPNVVKVDDGFTGKDVPTVEVVINREAVTRAGLSSFEIGTQLKSLLDETKVAKYENQLSGDQEDIYLINASKPDSIAEIKTTPLVSRTGSIMTVADLAEVRETGQVDTIERYNGDRYVTIRARVDDSKNVMAVQSKLNDYLTDDKLKSLSIDKKISKGELADISKSFTELGVALVIAIILTYLFLVLQFGSFSLPGIMIFTVPLSFIGVFPALWFTGSDLGFLELLGVTILVGIVENVAIFLIDYANQLRREKGLSAQEAIIQASGVRFRPILLTKLVALGGLLPLAIESPFWRGLSVVIIAGIGLSGFFSLAVIPILYVWIEKIRDKMSRA